jgi:hypothetical protein
LTLFGARSTIELRADFLADAYFSMESSAARPQPDEGLVSDLGRRMNAGRPLPAWVFSIATHLTLAVILALTIRAVPRGAAVEPARGAGIVLLQKHQGQREYFHEPGDWETDSPSTSQDAAPQSLAAALPTPERPPAEVVGVLPAGEQPFMAGADLAAALPGADGLTTGAARPRDFGGGVQTSIFGVQGAGSKFVYVFDRSSSMEGFEGRPMAAAKHELIASLGDLREVHQFQVIFYNDRVTICNAAPGLPSKLLYGNERDRSLAIEFVRGMRGAGGTRHFEALLAALNMAPDVIFFLTDAGEPALSAAEMEQIRRANRRAGASINTIEFGVGPPGGDNFLKRLAAQNNGRHGYVDVTRLKPGR